MHKLLLASFTVATLALSSPAVCDVIAERPPAGDFVLSWRNVSTDQNFLTQIVLGSDATLTSMTIWTQSSFTALGDSTTLRIRADVAGEPAPINLYELTAPVSAIGTTGFPDGVITATVDFSPLSLLAGTYWIGLSGTDEDVWGWASFNNGVSTPEYQRMLDGNTVLAAAPEGIYTLAYSISGQLGQQGAVPEPATWALMLMGFGATGLVMRRRKNRVSTQLA